MNLVHESRLTLRLALPLMIGQLSQMLLGVADALMIGHLGVTEMAALAFANSLFYVPFVFGIGLLTGISVITAHSSGANDPAAARGSCRHGLLLASTLGFLLFGIAWIASTCLDLFGQPVEVTERTTVFFRVLMASMIPALASIALKNHADALNRPWPSFWIFLGGVGMNVALNWIMIYGKCGCPALGFEGAAWATLISRTAILLAMILWLTRTPGLKGWVPDRWFRAPDYSDLRRLFAIGLPASIQMTCEVSAFSLTGLIMGYFGSISMAAHQIAITLASTAFMIPLGLSMALTVRVSEVRGAGKLQRLRPIAISGWLLALSYSVVAAISFLIFGKTAATLFIEDPEVIALAGSLLLVVGLFQVFDSLQVVSSAMLRGLQDTRVPAIMGFAAYGLVGLPVGAGLAFGIHLGAIGVWSGLATGLFVAAITLGPRLWKRTALPISKIS